MAGEIQLNSTTFATESGGTVTVSNVDSATNRTNLGLGSMATQNANAVALTGGSLTGTEIDLKSSGTTIYKSDGTTAVLSESSGVVTLDNIVYPSNNYFIHGSYSSGSASATPLIFTDSPTLNSSYFTVSSGVYTLVKAGVYFISFSGSANLGGQEEDELQVSIYKNSSTQLSMSVDQIVDTAGTQHGSATATFVGRFSASDTIDFRLDSAPDSNATVDSSTHFSLMLLFPE